LEIEKRRLATIDDAERQARVEIAENRERAKQEELREQAEKDALLEWEAFVPDPPPPPEEFEVKEYLEEEKAVVLADESKIQLSPEWGEERIEELKAALTPENLEGGKRVLATQVPGPEDGVIFLGEFRVAEAAPPADEAAAEAPEDA